MDSRSPVTSRQTGHKRQNAEEQVSSDTERSGKRQRILACRRCRSRKQKCEDTRPCNNCQKSNADCVPTEPAPRQHVESEYVRALEDRIAELEAQSLDPQHSADHHIHHGGLANGNRSWGPVQGRHATDGVYSPSSQRTSSIPIPVHQSRPSESNSESNQVEEAHPSPSSTRAAAVNLLQDFPAEGDLSDCNDADLDIDHLILGLAASPAVRRDPHHSKSPGNCATYASTDQTVFMPHALVASIPAEVEHLLLNVYRERAQTQYPFFHWETFLSWHHSWKTCLTTQYTENSWQGFFINIAYATALLLRPFPRIGRSDAQTFYTHGLSLLPSVLKQGNTLLHVQAYLLLTMYALHRSSTQRILTLVSTTMRYCVQQQFHLAETEPDPATSINRLEIQMRRRCFWCAYTLDRLIVASFDLPPSVPDSMITVKVFANIEDYDILDVASRTPSDQELPDAPKYTSVSPALHILQCRRIQSEIAGFTLRWDYSLQFEKSLDWRVRILAELENYKLRARKFSDPKSKGYASQRWLAMIYSYSLLNLYRPTKDNVIGPAGDWSVQASTQACLTFRKTQMDRQIASPWIALLVQFQSGVTLLYCFFATPPEHRTENYDAPDVSDALRACSNILAIMSDKWPKADCLRDVFELLAREVPLVDRPSRPPTRFSERSVAAILEKLPEVRALVVHRSILRMIEEMISEDFPRLQPNAVDARAQMPIYTPRNDALPRSAVQTYQELSPTWSFEMPFSAQQIYDFSTQDQDLDSDALLAFPGMFDLDGWG